MGRNKWIKAGVLPPKLNEELKDEAPEVEIKKRGKKAKTEK